MTFSILTHDRETGIFAAAAATGSLCVGGWVIRGDIDAGLVASQGTAPSTFWRDDGLRLLYEGKSAPDVVAELTAADAGCGHRQFSALDGLGRTAGFTGGDSVAYAGHLAQEGLVAAGNMLTGPEVLEAMRDAALTAGLSAPERMLRVLEAAQGAGGDARGLQSAALLVLDPHHPPLDLRIDCDDTPVKALRTLCERAHSAPYHGWLDVVPVATDRSRTPG